MYLEYARPRFSEAQAQLSVTYDHNADQMPYPASSYYEPRATYNEPAPSSIVSYGSRELPEITSHAPQQGSQGSQVYVYLRSAYDLNNPSSLLISLMFATRRCMSDLNQIEAQGSSYEYVLTSNVPPFSDTGCSSPQVPLRLHVQEESGLEIGMIDVGSYFYTDSIQRQYRESPDDISRKRRLSIEHTGALRFPSKRSSNQQLQSKSIDSYTSYPFAQGEISAYSQPPATSSAQIPHAAYGRSPSSRSLPDSDLLRQRTQEHSVGLITSQNFKVSSPHTSSWKSSLSAVSQCDRGLALTAASTAGGMSISSPTVSANPPLIRTSTLQQSPSPAATPAASSLSNLINPYAMYPHKAVLKIKGNLDSMADKWTADEWSSKRRLVQFWRSQSGSTIHTNFAPVTPENRQPNSICISCIWWEERQERFVTSVDTIYLLESLVALRFGVEEKNRIRRNLEGFRPMTVSKAKPDSEEFFKIIMGFPNPKPRNIEKDVKVFQWKILVHALKKIIGKYVSHGKVHNLCDRSMMLTCGSLQATHRLPARCPRPGAPGMDQANRRPKRAWIIVFLPHRPRRPTRPFRAPIARP